MRNVQVNTKVLMVLFFLLSNTFMCMVRSQNQLSLDYNHVPLSHAIKEIEKETDYTFFINDTRVDVRTMVPLAVNNPDLEQTLKNVFASTNYTYEIIGKQILVRIKDAVAPNQNKIAIKGSVTDERGEPVIGANVVEVDTSNGAITNADGLFSLEVAPGAMIKISMIGYTPQVIAVEDRTTFEVVLKEDTELLDEVVVIGYGTIKKSDLTGAVASISAKDLQANIAQSVAGALQGRVAGVTVGNSGGAPGAGMSVNIRGLSSIGNSNTPLYLIDGVYGDINMIDPSDVVSMEILKDGSAAAIYGSRAANGVVLITTKGGKREAPLKVDFNIYTGMQDVVKKLDVMNANQWISTITTKYDTYANNPAAIPGLIKNWKGGKGTNWQDEGFRTALILKTNLSLSGGGKNSTYNVSVGYMRQDGIMLNSGYDAINVRTKNVFYLLDDHIRIGNTFFIKSWKQKINQSNLTDYLRQNPLIPVYDENNLGGYGAFEPWMRNIANPIGNSKLFDKKKDGTDIFINAFAEVDLFVEGLKYKLNVGYNKSDVRDFSFNPEYNFGAGNSQSNISEGADFTTQWLVENTLNFDREFGKHNVSALLGYSAQKNEGRGFSALRNDVPPGVSSIGGASNATEKTGGSARANAIVSLFGRAMYSYDTRYMISASIRRDGSSRFADGHRFGVFPSVSAGWNMMNENFFQPLRTVVDELKIRASYGVLGNQEIGDYTTQNTVTNFLHYLIQSNGQWDGAITGANWVSPKDLTWEETRTANIGLDGNLWNGRLTFTADYYVQETKNILLGINMPSSIGMGGSPIMNAGVISNKGFELAVNHRNTIGELSYNVGLNLSTVENEVKEVTVGSVQEFAGWKSHEESEINAAKVGYPIGAFFLVKTDGIFQNEAEIQAHTKDGKLIQPNAKPGDIKYIDANNDGQISYDDRRYAGDPFPDFSFGIRMGAQYKGFDLNLFFDGTYGNKIYNYTRTRMESNNEMRNYSTKILDSWTPQNTNTDIPRFDMIDLNENSKRVSDRWLENGSYIRLKTLEFGYSLPTQWLSKAKIDRLRIYTAMENLFTITKYKGYTPDLGQNSDMNGGGTGVFTRGVDYGRYPQARTISLGIQLNF